MDVINHIMKLVHMAKFRQQQIQMFYDFVERSAIMISNAVDPAHRASRTERQAQIEAGHTPEELSEMNRCFKALVFEIKEKALSGIFEDILGRAFEACGLLPFKGNASCDYVLKRATIPYYDAVLKALELESGGQYYG